MDRNRLNNFLEAAKAFLISRRSREALVFAFFVLISAGFWLIQTLNETYDMDLTVPLTLENVPQGTVLTTELPDHILVTVRDKGSSLLKYYARRAPIAMTVDFSARDKGGEFGHVTISHAEVQKVLQPKVESSSRIVAIRPDTLEYYYTRGVEKRVPVVFRGHIQPEALYYLADVRCDPDTITVWGEQHFLDSLTAVQTVVTNLSGLSETTVRDVQLASIRGVKLEPAVVKLTAEIDVFTEKRVQVPIVGTNFPGGYSLRTFPASATISFRVGAKDYKRITADNFVLTATYEELLSLPDSMLTLQLRSVPEGVSQVQIKPAAVQFLIEQTEDE